MANSTGEGKGLSDRALTALLEDIQADCTAEKIQAIWQRAIYVKTSPWQTIADLFNAHPLAVQHPDSALRFRLGKRLAWDRKQLSKSVCALMASERTPPMLKDEDRAKELENSIHEAYASEYGPSRSGIVESILKLCTQVRLEEAKWWIPLVPNGISKAIEEEREQHIAALEAAAKGKIHD